MLRILQLGMFISAAVAGPSDSCSLPQKQMGLGGENLNSSYSDPLLNISKCCDTCNKLVHCKGWTLNAVKKMCYLKDVLDHEPKPNTKCVASGTKTGPVPSPPPTPSPPPSPPRPSGAKNVLFIPVDDMRPSLGIYGQPVHSPNFDRLGNSGTVFNRAYAQFSWCSPSRNSFMSGRRPDRTKAWDFGTDFRLVGETWVALPEYFKHFGYFTTGVGKLFHKGNPPNFDPVSW
jgi:hypothetical protein